MYLIDIMFNLETVLKPEFYDLDLETLAKHKFFMCHCGVGFAISSQPKH